MISIKYDDDDELDKHRHGYLCRTPWVKDRAMVTVSIGFRLGFRVIFRVMVSIHSINQSINQSIRNCLSSRATSRLIVKLNNFWFR